MNALLLWFRFHENLGTTAKNKATRVFTKIVSDLKTRDALVSVFGFMMDSSG